ncbi:MAG: hypothetical protein ACLP62_06755 [Acidimicrobiales bacterium]
MTPPAGGTPPTPPYGPGYYYAAPYPWGPPPGGIPYPPAAPAERHTLTLGRLAAVLLALAILLVGLGVGIGIGAAVWSGGQGPVSARFPGLRGPTGSIRIGTGQRLPATGSATPGRPRIGNGGFGFGGFGGTTGTITKVSGTAVTVKEADGSTVTVTVPSSAKITVTKPGSTSDLASGACVRVAGGRTAPAATGGSSSVKARAVQVLPAADCSS